MEKTYLFVYGTLRSEFSLENANKLKQGLVLFVKGTVKATLFDIGNYPAAVEGSETDRLHGEVYEVLRPDKSFQVLDAYEGEEYIRKLTEVKLPDGNVLKAWMYWAAIRMKDKHRILENDYLVYLKNKKDRFV